MIRVHSIETFSTQDWPWIRLVVFLQGCHFKCLYCHNPDTIPEKWGKMMEDEEIIEYINKQRGYIKNWGITFSGGEPTLQAKNLIPLFKKIKEMGVHICIDSNGFILTPDVKELLSYVDLVLLDIKHIDNEMHKKLTGQPNVHTLQMLEYLESDENRKHNNTKYWVRHVYVPWWTAIEKYVHQLGQFLQNRKNLEEITILPYHTLGVEKWEAMGWKYGLEGVKPPTAESVAKAKEILSEYVDCRVR